MGTFKKIDSGKWQAQVARAGIRKSKSFPTKQAAKDWAARQEYLISQGEGQKSKELFGDVLERYGREVSTTKKGHHWESGQIGRLLKHWISSKPIGDIVGADIARWRDERLLTVKGSTVNREMNLLSNVFTVARRDWGLINESPCTDVRRPKGSPHRDRRVSDAEIEALRAATGFDDTKPVNVEQSALAAFLFAIETAMRAGEIAKLTWANVYIDKRFAHLPDTKNGEARDVPLSSRAIELIEIMGKGDPVFGLTDMQISTAFMRIRKRAKIEGLTFHDSRHEACTRLSKKLHVLALARVIGHRDLKMLQIYYNESASDLAGLLD